MAESAEYRCAECETVVRRSSPPARCPHCHTEGSLRPVDSPGDGSDAGEEQGTTRNYRAYLAVILVALVLVVVTVGVLDYYRSAPDGYVNSEGEQETIFGEPLNRTEIEREIHRFVNEERRKRGLDPLAFDSRLQGIARNHSRDMVVRGYFKHVSPDGQTVTDRYRAAGYDCEIRTESGIVTGNENIFVTYAGKVRAPDTDGTVDYEHNETKIARGTVDGWLNSSGHRHILLRPYWQREGIGVVINSENETGTRVLVTQNLC